MGRITRIVVALAFSFSPLFAQSGPPTQGSSQSGAAWNDPHNPAPSIIVCPTCPPALVNLGSQDGSFGTGLGGPNPSGAGSLPPVPGEGATGIPTEPSDPGGCNFAICWEVLDVPVVTPWGTILYYQDKLVESFGGTGNCGTGTLPGIDHCRQFPIFPCIEDAAGGQCTLEALKKMAKDFPELPLDPTKPDGPKWKDFGDTDSDGIPNLFDLYPKGPLGTGEANPKAPVPTDPDQLKQLLTEIGSSPALIDLLLSDPNWIPGGNYTAGQLFKDIKDAINKLHQALEQQLGALHSIIQYMQTATLTYQQQWDAFITALSAYIDAAKELLTLSQGFEKFADDFPAEEFFGSEEAKAAFLSALHNMGVNAANSLGGFKAALAQASEIATQLHNGDLKVAVKVDGKQGPELQLLPHVPPGLDFLMQHPEGSPILVTNVDGSPSQKPEEKIPPQHPSPDLPVVASSTVGDPVDTWSGELVHKELDLSIPGRGFDFSITRTYRSRSKGRGMFGPGWTSPLEARLMVFPDPISGQRFLVLEVGDGTQRGFRYDNSSGLWLEQKGGFAKMQQDTAQTPWTPASEQATNGFVLREPNGNFLHFCPPSLQLGDLPVPICWLKKISDPYGNAIIFSRDAFGRLKEVTDTLGRKYFFTYDQDRFLQEITGPEGVKIVYDYDRTDLLPPTPPGQSTGRGPVSTGGGQSSGFGTQIPPFQIDPQAPVEYKKRDLISVTYWPSVPVLEASGSVVMKQRFHRYSYATDPAGFVESPDSSLNHNLISVRHDEQGPAVQFEYYTNDPISYEFDRVKSYTIAGKTTRYRYAGGNIDPGNAYGQTIAHRTEVFFPQSEGALGHVERFDHDADGNLLRHEIRDGLYDANFAFSSAPANSVGAFVTLMAYNEDRLLVEETRTSEAGFAAGKKRVAQYLFDTANPDRFQQGRLLQVTAIPDPTVPSDFAELTSSFTYEPLRGEFATRTDSMGRTTKYYFEYQESSYAEVSQWLGVKQWGINLSTFPLGLGDLNGDGRADQRGFALIRKESPAVEVAAPAGPGGSLTKSPTEIWEISLIGQILKHCAVDQVCDQNEYEGGMLTRSYATLEGALLESHMEYDGLGRVRVLTAPDGSRIETSYDTTGLPLEAKQIAIPGSGDPSIVRQFFYDLSGHLVGEANPSYGAQATAYGAGMTPSLSAKNSFDVAGQKTARQIWIETPLGVQTGTWQFGYDSRGRVERVTSPSLSNGASLSTLGIVMRTERDARGLTIAKHRFAQNGASLGSETLEYSAYGEPTRAIASVDSDGDGQLDQVQSFYDGYGRLVGDLSALGARSELTLDAGGRLLHSRIFNASNHLLTASHASYDALDRVVEAYEENFETLSDGQIVPLIPGEFRTRFGYDIAGRLLWQLADPHGKAYLRRVEYDGLGRTKAVFANQTKEAGVSVQRDALGRILEVHRQHDALGQTGANDPSLTTTRYAYDGHGRLKSRTDAIGGIAQFLEYSAIGQPGRTIDARGNQTLFAYDTAGRTWQSTEIGIDGLTRTNKREYDLLNLVASIDPKNQRSEYEYDDLRRLTRKRFADQSEERYTVYDYAGRLLQMVKPDGSLFVMNYNAASQLTSLQANSAQASALSVHRQFEYDALGRATRVDDRVGSGPTISSLQRYSSSDLLLEQTSSAPAFGWNRSFMLEFDSAGQTKKIQYPSGFWAGYEYDAMGRWQTISSSQGLAATKTQPYGGSYKEVVLGNGAKIRQTHDARGLVLEREIQSIEQQTVFGERYGYDANRNLTSRARVQNGSIDLQESFTYDGFDRLSHWSMPGGAGALPRAQDFQHDLGDNLTQFTSTVNGASQSQTGDFSNALNQCESFAPLYSSIGFTGNGEQSSLLLQGGAQVLLQWDALGRVATAQKLTASGMTELSIQYYWDAGNQLFGRLESSGHAEFFERLEGEIFGSVDTQTGHFDYLRDPSGNAFLRSRGNEKIYFLHDPLMNPRVALSQDGKTALERYHFTPYGERFDPQNASASFASSPVDMQMSYLDQPLDKALGLHFLGERLYDSKMGRFLSRDPLGEAGSQSSNLYSYARRNPLRYHDRSGLSVAETQNPASGGGGFWASVTSGISSAWETTKQEVIPRAFGVMQAGGGLLEGLGGAVVTTGGTIFGVTGAIGGAAGGAPGAAAGAAPGIVAIFEGIAILTHAADNIAAGLKTTWDGQPHQTLTEAVLDKKVGMSREAAAAANGVLGFLASGGFTWMKNALTLPPNTTGLMPQLAGAGGSASAGLVGEAGAGISGAVPVLVGAAETSAAMVGSRGGGTGPNIIIERYPSVDVPPFGNYGVIAKGRGRFDIHVSNIDFDYVRGVNGNLVKTKVPNYTSVYVEVPFARSQNASGDIIGAALKQIGVRPDEIELCIRSVPSEHLPVTHFLLTERMGVIARMLGGRLGRSLNNVAEDIAFRQLLADFGAAEFGGPPRANVDLVFRVLYSD